MSRTAACSAALLLLASCVGAGWSDMSVDEARALAEQTVGWSLEGWDVETRVDVNTLITFVWGGRRCTVDASSGSFRGYSRTWAGTGQPARLSQEEGLAIAKQEAERIMGPLASSLRWRKAPPRVLTASRQPVDGPPVEFVGDGPNLADPPRIGLAPYCKVAVDLSDGKVYGYVQTIPCDPVPVSVSQERAQEIARHEIGDPAGGIIKCELHQDGVRAYWLVKIRTPAEPQFIKEWDEKLGVMGYHYAPGQSKRIYAIDAVTGEVFHRDAVSGGQGGAEAGVADVGGEGAMQSASSAPAIPSPAPEPAPRTRWLPALVVAGAAVVLLCAAAAVFLIRRRR